MAHGRCTGTGTGSNVWVVDVDAGAVAAVLEGQPRTLAGLAGLPDGALVSASCDGSMRVWDVGARACVATLAHPGVTLLTVLADGRLASGAQDGTVRLWDVGAAICVGVLNAHGGGVQRLAALPDGRLATVCGSGGGSIQLWDTRPAAAAASSRAAGAVPALNLERLSLHIFILNPLPDGRLICGGTVVILC